MIDALRRRRWSLAWLTGVVAVGLVLAWLASVPLLRAGDVPRGGAALGEPAPPLSLDDLDGRRWSLEDAGGRLVWINFWATSCEPCRTEMPAMERIGAAYSDDLLILGVNWGEAPDVVGDFVARYGVSYPILLDPGLETYYAWAATDGLPRHVFVGAEGTVVREVVGPLDPTRMVEIVEELMAP